MSDLNPKVAYDLAYGLAGCPPLTEEGWYGLQYRPFRRAFDAPYRLALIRRQRAERTGQMWLTPEIEYSPLAPEEIPGPVYDRLIQTDFFRP